MDRVKQGNLRDSREIFSEAGWLSGIKHLVQRIRQHFSHVFRADGSEKVNLMVFIHPSIVRDPRTADYYSGQKYSYLRTRQLEAEIRRRGLLRDDAARLPERIEDLRDLVSPPPGGEPLMVPDTDAR